MSLNSVMKSNGYVNTEKYLKNGLIFKSIHDYISIFNVDNWLHFLYKLNGECEIHKKFGLIHTITNNTEFRKDEELFYYTLKKVSELIDEIKPNCFVLMNEEAFFVIEFFYESKDFRDNNLKAIKKLIKFQEIQKIDFKSYQNNDIRLFYLNLLLKKSRVYLLGQKK